MPSSLIEICHGPLSRTQCRLPTPTVATPPWSCAGSLLLDVARFLKEDPALRMNFLMDVTAVDYSDLWKEAHAGFLRFLRRCGEPLVSDSG